MVGRRHMWDRGRGVLCPYGHVLAFHQTYLLHVMDAMGGKEQSKWKCTMSVWAPNSESHSRACRRLAGKSIDWIIFNLNKVRRKMLARGAWKCGMTKAMQSQIGSLEAKHEIFNEVFEKRTWPTGWELFEDSGMIPQTGRPNRRSGGRPVTVWLFAVSNLRLDDILSYRNVVSYLVHLIRRPVWTTASYWTCCIPWCH